MGNGGNDTFTGGGGNDKIVGGNGTNVIDGSNPILLGANEHDSLVGGGYGSTDIFMLGTATQTYYGGGGSGDYASISNFDAGSDVIVLAGQGSDYTISYLNGTASILKNGDLIAKIDNAPAGLDLVNGSYFYYPPA